MRGTPNAVDAMSDSDVQSTAPDGVRTPRTTPSSSGGLRVRRGLSPEPLSAEVVERTERALARLVALAYAKDHPHLFGPNLAGREPAGLRSTRMRAAAGVVGVRHDICAATGDEEILPP